MFFHPFLVLSEHLGKSFRVLFKEIPVQWQLLVFVALCVMFLLAIGIQVYTPILRIGRGENNAPQLAYREQIQALTNQVNNLQAQLEARPVNRNQLNHLHLQDAPPQGEALEDLPPQNMIDNIVQGWYFSAFSTKFILGGGAAHCIPSHSVYCYKGNIL